jgi:hypothetical protein
VGMCGDGGLGVCGGKDGGKLMMYAQLRGRLRIWFGVGWKKSIVHYIRVFCCPPSAQQSPSNSTATPAFARGVSLENADV